MQIGSLHSQKNPNAYWINHSGFWLTYFTIIAILHFSLMSIPFFSTAVAWTLTNALHSFSSYLAFHFVKGAPFDTESVDEGAMKFRTHWEQIDKGKQMTWTKKMLIVVPVILFILASFYTEYAINHSIVNMIALLVGVLPKLPQFHLVRFFGINEF
ncbi:ORM1-like protein 2-like [Oopsacas minuta]|uniref:ORM1-like protein 2-like n=1 Tax=Oopsacas minuta TaxID=111878 RepID=A0AAV7JB77_9METZ|nr:ORM1-like protein 2-like [Oopsacas minuta]